MTPTNFAARDWWEPHKLAELDKFRLRARHFIDGLIAGLHRHPRMGQSTEFAGHRDYSPGDDPRQLDWRAFARSDRWQVKRYQDETNLRTWLVVAAGPTMQFGGDPMSLTKWQYAQLLAAALAWIVLQQRDAVGLSIVDQSIRAFMPASNSRRQWDEIVTVLDQDGSTGHGNWAYGLPELAARVPRRGLVILIGDCLSESAALTRSLRQLAAHEHDLRLIQVADRMELTFPYEGMMRFVGMDQRDSLELDALRFREAYLQELRETLVVLQTACQASRIAYQLCPTDQRLDHALLQILQRDVASYKHL